MTIFGCCDSTLMFAHASNSFSSCLFRARYCLVLHGYLTAHGLFTGMTDKSRLMPHITGHGSAWAGASLGLAITAGNPRHGYRYGFITMRLSTETQLRQCSKLKHVGVRNAPVTAENLMQRPSDWEFPSLGTLASSTTVSVNDYSEISRTIIF